MRHAGPGKDTSKSTIPQYSGEELSRILEKRGGSIADIVKDILTRNVRISGKIWYNATM